ncbi:hypothetical protein ACHHYP_14957 [Achlya hypogyna]|uniref:Helicase-associated domain-containing protein n=1 Tax=Achlya hypogyna TaxID=1202772 RepID=A0A1V9YBY9_ACHHY|nr:hypothetical protein ACHHYP_14957 [Achlya hypogyna]
MASLRPKGFMSAPINHPLRLQIVALHTYRCVYGHSDVPPDFVVPDESPWSQDTVGMRLGFGVQVMRAARKELDPNIEAALETLSIVWNEDQSRVRCIFAQTRAVKAIRWDKVMAALFQFFASHGHINVPPRWAVPYNSDYPSDMADIDLSHCVKQVEMHPYTLTSVHLRRAHEIGLVQTIPVWADVLSLLKLFRDGHGAADIPVEYIVKGGRPINGPTGPVWPPKFDGLALGDIARRIWVSYAHLSEYRRRDLADVQFCFNTPTTWQVVVSGAAWFQLRCGHDRIPESYVVPTTDATWPPELHGLRLGALAALMHKYHTSPNLPPRDSKRTRVQLPEPASVFDVHLAALQIYKEIYGDVLVPDDFVVPITSSRWPADLADLPLGEITQALRQDRRTLSDVQRAGLTDVGFVWDPATAVLWPDLLRTLELWRERRPQASWADDAVLPPDWPSATAGQPLGYFLALLEAHEDFGTEARRSELLKVGFDADKRWRAKLRALKAFRALHGHLHVPPAFVLSHDAGDGAGLPLGAAVQWLRHFGPGIDPVKHRELEAVGFEWQAGAAPSVTSSVVDWTSLLVSLRVFAQQHGHTQVPMDFVVPADDTRWPRVIRNYPLGPAAAHARANDGVVPNGRSAWSREVKKPPLALQLAGIGIYRRLNGHSDVPLDFVVPATKPWPSTMHDMPLGLGVSVMRASRTHFVPAIEAAFEDLNFVWPRNPPVARCLHASDRRVVMLEWDVLLNALRVFRTRYGHVNVPSGWIVPDNAQHWAHALWGVDLGHGANLVERNPYVLSSAQLTLAHSIGLLTNMPLWEVVLEQLAYYRDFHGAADIPANYVVFATRKRKAGTADWPEKWHGVALGEVAWFIWSNYAQLSQRRQADLAAVGFAWNTETSWAQIVAAREHFKRTYGHDCVPTTFAVPKDDAAWPPEMRGLALGHLVARMTKCQSWYVYTADKRIDVRLPPTPTPFELDRAALDLYKQIHGTTLVPPEYVVPPEDERWPRQFASTPLGAVVDNLRRSKPRLTLVERASLVDLGFVWDPARAGQWPDLVRVLDLWHRLRPGQPWADAFTLTKQWPVAFAGRLLGDALALLEAHDDFATESHRHQLRKLGLDVDARWLAKLQALTAFANHHGHLDVPPAFVVPEACNEWPAVAGGLPLGRVVTWLRDLRDNMEPIKQRELDALGFPWVPPVPVVASVQRVPVLTTVSPPAAATESTATATGDIAMGPEPPVAVDAAEVIDWSAYILGLFMYREQYGHTDVPRAFVVPKDDMEWPGILIDYALGDTVCRIETGVHVPPEWVLRQAALMQLPVSQSRSVAH